LNIGIWDFIGIWCLEFDILEESVTALLKKSLRLWERLSSRHRARMPYESIDVECYSGYRANERPVAFTFQGRRWQVEEIIDRWYEGEVQSNEPALDYFKVRTVEGRVFLLRYNSLFDAWSIRVPAQSTH
jgi:hypothetical protein